MTVVGARVTVRRDFEETTQALREALAGEGFGVLTEIDVQATLREKIGAEIEPYVILGVCNPGLARRALDVDRSVGLLLPCTVVVRGGDDGHTVVEGQDPSLIATFSDRSELGMIADEAGRRLAAAIARLTDIGAA